MGHLLAYAITSSIILSLLYLTYKWALSSENYHRMNRAVIWLAYIISLGLVPLWNHLSEFFSPASGNVAVVGIGDLVATGIVGEETAGSFDWLGLLVWTYAIGLCLVVLLTFSNFFRLVSIIHQGERVAGCDRKVILTDDAGLAPFSFCGTIVIPRKDFESYGDMILLHEKSHVELCHWADLMFAQSVCAIQWFNPAAWLMREELKTIHEYQADANVIASGTNIKDYQMLLIKKAVGARFPSLANSLNHSKLKKRITMMYNQKSSRRRILRPLLLLPALGAALWISQHPAVASAMSSVASASLSEVESSDKVSDNSADPQVSVIDMPGTSGRVLSVTKNEGNISTTTTMTVPSSEEDSAPAKVAQKMPSFPGGEKAMMEYLYANIKYPQGAEKVQGRVVVKFVVEKDGSIGDVSVIRSVDPRLDAEAIRVVKSFPKWTPGQVDGKPVCVYYTLPVNFSLRDDSDNASSGKAGSKPVSVSTFTSTTTVSGESSPRTVSFTTVEPGTGEPSYNVLVTSDGETDLSKIAIYVNGERFEGDLNSIPPSDIESMTVDKSDKTGTSIRITLKKK